MRASSLRSVALARMAGSYWRQSYWRQFGDSNATAITMPAETRPHGGLLQLPN